MRAAAIGPLADLASAEVAALVADSERAGLRLVRRLVEEWTDGTNRFARPGEVLLGARIDGRLVGVCGLNVDPYLSDARVGRVRHLYVLASCRRLGVARQLMTRIIEAAQGSFDTLRLSTSNPAAARLYETLGFRSIAVSHCTHLMAVATAQRR
jgi:GNAT superfamily N-acetyltransferase